MDDPFRSLAYHLLKHATRLDYPNVFRDYQTGRPVTVTLRRKSDNTWTISAWLPEQGSMDEEPMGFYNVAYGPLHDDQNRIIGTFDYSDGTLKGIRFSLIEALRILGAPWCSTMADVLEADQKEAEREAEPGRVPT